MNICFHHVGELGASKDFPKTVYNTVSIEDIINYIPDTITQKSKIIDELRSRFPQGEANCWGVPSGARSVIRNLKENDVVLLVEKASINGGLVPIKCRVLVYHVVELYGLSEALWGSDKFPYIFFFNTESLNLAWIDFINHINYKENFRVCGQLG
ncbi:hypothetical protein [Rudanella lutea]|uniref:hypothetical protein n=1 Tax=Rudanella lutea TaxID=451374 RepID=UPI0012F7ADAA|nr:hypothetical protein [Rudanella lutea]